MAENSEFKVNKIDILYVNCFQLILIISKNHQNQNAWRH